MANGTISKITVPSGDTYEFAPDYATKARNLVDNEHKEIYANYKENNFAVTDTDRVADKTLVSSTQVKKKVTDLFTYNKDTGILTFYAPQTDEEPYSVYYYIGSNTVTLPSDLVEAGWLDSVDCNWEPDLSKPYEFNELNNVDLGLETMFTVNETADKYINSLFTFGEPNNVSVHVEGDTQVNIMLNNDPYLSTNVIDLYTTIYNEYTTELGPIYENTIINPCFRERVIKDTEAHKEQHECRLSSTVANKLDGIQLNNVGYIPCNIKCWIPNPKAVAEQDDEVYGLNRLSNVFPRLQVTDSDDQSNILKDFYDTNELEINHNGPKTVAKVEFWYDSDIGDTTDFEDVKQNSRWLHFVKVNEEASNPTIESEFIKGFASSIQRFVGTEYCTKEAYTWDLFRDVQYDLEYINETTGESGLRQIAPIPLFTDDTMEECDEFVSHSIVVNSDFKFGVDKNFTFDSVGALVDVPDRDISSVLDSFRNYEPTLVIPTFATNENLLNVKLPGAVNGGSMYQQYLPYLPKLYFANDNYKMLYLNDGPYLQNWQTMVRAIVITDCEGKVVLKHDLLDGAAIKMQFDPTLEDIEEPISYRYLLTWYEDNKDLVPDADFKFDKETIQALCAERCDSVFVGDYSCPLTVNFFFEPIKNN